MALRRVDHVTHRFGQFAVTKLGFVCGNLHGNGEKATLIACDVRLEQCFELVRTSHQ